MGAKVSEMFHITIEYCTVRARFVESEDHGRVHTGTIRRSGRLLHAGSHRTAGSLLMPVRITRKDYKDYKDTVTFATGGGLTANKD